MEYRFNILAPSVPVFTTDQRRAIAGAAQEYGWKLDPLNSEAFQIDGCAISIVVEVTVEPTPIQEAQFVALVVSSMLMIDRKDIEDRVVGSATHGGRPHSSSGHRAVGPAAGHASQEWPKTLLVRGGSVKGYAYLEAIKYCVEGVPAEGAEPRGVLKVQRTYASQSKPFDAIFGSSAGAMTVAVLAADRWAATMQGTTALESSTLAELLKAQQAVDIEEVLGVRPMQVLYSIPNKVRAAVHGRPISLLQWEGHNRWFAGLVDEDLREDWNHLTLERLAIQSNLTLGVCITDPHFGPTLVTVLDDGRAFASTRSRCTQLSSYNHMDDFGDRFFGIACIAPFRKLVQASSAIPILFPRPSDQRLAMMTDGGIHANLPLLEYKQLQQHLLRENLEGRKAPAWTVSSAMALCVREETPPNTEQASPFSLVVRVVGSGLLTLGPSLAYAVFYYPNSNLQASTIVLGGVSAALLALALAISIVWGLVLSFYRTGRDAIGALQAQDEGGLLSDRSVIAVDIRVGHRYPMHRLAALSASDRDFLSLQGRRGMMKAVQVHNLASQVEITRIKKLRMEPSDTPAAAIVPLWVKTTTRLALLVAAVVVALGGVVVVEVVARLNGAQP